MSDVESVDAKTETPPSGDEQALAPAAAPDAREKPELSEDDADPSAIKDLDARPGAEAVISEAPRGDMSEDVDASDAGDADAPDRNQEPQDQEPQDQEPQYESVLERAAPDQHARDRDARDTDVPDTDAQEREASSPEANQTPDVLDIARIRTLFTRAPEVSSAAADTPDETPEAPDTGDALSDGPFVFAKWSRPIAPRLFGLDEGSAAGVLDGLSEAARRAGVEMIDEDPEFEANLLFFACEQWGDLLPTPGLDRLIPDLAKLIALLGATGANQYHIFSFDPDGGIQFATVLVRVDEHIERQSPRALGLDQMARVLLLWSDAAFLNETPVTANRRGEARLKPWFVDLLAAAYDDETPVRSEDPELCESLATKSATRRAAAKEAAAEARAARRQNAEQTRGEGESDPEGGSGASKRRAQRRRRKGSRHQETETQETETQETGTQETGTQDGSPEVAEVAIAESDAPPDRVEVAVEEFDEAPLEAPVVVPQTDGPDAIDIERETAAAPTPPEASFDASVQADDADRLQAEDVSDGDRRDGADEANPDAQKA